jgi:hypothetical protein
MSNVISLKQRQSTELTRVVSLTPQRSLHKNIDLTPTKDSTFKPHKFQSHIGVLDLDDTIIEEEIKVENPNKFQSVKDDIICVEFIEDEVIAEEDEPPREAHNYD